MRYKIDNGSWKALHVALEKFGALYRLSGFHVLMALLEFAFATSRFH